MIYPKMLNILSQAYTLSPLRDDLAVTPYQIQKISDPAHLAKRQPPVVTLYWDRNGHIKAVFKMHISWIVAQVLQYEGVNLAQSVMGALRAHAMVYGETETAISQGATWASQLGTNWRNILDEYGGQATIGILIKLRPAVLSDENTTRILQLLQAWFNLSGYSEFAVEVQDASRAGIDGGNRIERRSLTERQTVEARSDSKFCKPTIQNWQFVLTPGKLDTLLAPLITC